MGEDVRAMVIFYAFGCGVLFLELIVTCRKTSIYALEDDIRRFFVHCFGSLALSRRFAFVH